AGPRDEPVAASTAAQTVKKFRAKGTLEICFTITGNASIRRFAARETPPVSRDYRHPGAGQYRLPPGTNRSAPRSIRGRSGRDSPFYARNRSANRSTHSHAQDGVHCDGGP